MWVVKVDLRHECWERSSSPPWPRRGGRASSKWPRSLECADGVVCSSKRVSGAICSTWPVVVRRIHNRKEKQPKRRGLRNSATAAEATLWKHLQRRRIDGRKFRRQHGIGPYIVDFYCPECRLVVELDGQPHYELIADLYEAERTKYFAQLGIKNRPIRESTDLRSA
jgi:very-short-patch-repair endonuclease